MDENQLQHIFFPYAADKFKEVEDNALRFVYYTNAETAYHILTSNQIWMRSISTMNDYSEVEHGIQCLFAAYKSEGGIKLKQAIDDCYPGLMDEAVAQFNDWLPAIRNQTYITCLSEHPADEDQNGRLSMWRAYGSKAGVALVINAAALFQNPGDIGLFSSPVAYRTKSAVETELRLVAARVRENSRDVQELGREVTKQVLFIMFRSAVLCTKHPGFAEEREWRIFASPSMDASPLLTQAVEVVGGVPQTIQKLQLANQPEVGVIGLALPELLNRVIIGPCDHPLPLLFALRELLKALNVPNPEKLVHVSDIPLRITG